MHTDTNVQRLRRITGKKWSQYSDDVIPAWVADMDLPAAPPIQAFLSKVVADYDYGYWPDPKSQGLGEIFSSWAERHYGWAPDPGTTEALIDVIQGIYVGLEVYCDPQDGVVIQTPIYPPFLKSVKDLNRRLLANPLVRGAHRYEVDFDHLRSLMDRGTRVLMLCNPHNPCGRAFDRQELEAMAEVVLANDLIVLADEIHADLVFDGRPHIPFASLGPEIAARTVSFYSVSKAFNVAGLRCAIAVCGSDALQRRFNQISPKLRGGGGLGVGVTRVAWTEGEPWLRENLALLQANRDRVAEFVRTELPGVEFRTPEATFLAWLDFAGLGLDRDPQEHLLERAKVVLSAGPTFGPGGENCARLNFGTTPDILDEVLHRMADGLRG